MCILAAGGARERGDEIRKRTMSERRYEEKEAHQTLWRC